VTRRRGKIRKQLLEDLKEKGGYCNLKVKELDVTLWRTRVGKSYEPAVRQTTQRIKSWHICFSFVRSSATTSC